MTVTFNEWVNCVDVDDEDGVRIGTMYQNAQGIWYLQPKACAAYEAELRLIADKLAELNGEVVGE